MTSQTAELQHLAYNFPSGGEPQRWVVEPMYFRDFYKLSDSITIPIFQRTYCWTSNQISGWFRDIRQAKADAGIAPGHRVGKIMFTRRLSALTGAQSESASSDATSSVQACSPAGLAPERCDMLVIDGQQRITTSMLFLSAVRDVVLTQIARSDIDAPHNRQFVELCAEIDSIIFRDSAQFREWLAATAEQLKVRSCNLVDCIQEGESLHFSRLIPSFPDRQPYFELITLGHFKSKDLPPARLNVSASSSLSVQFKAKSHFDDQITTIVAERSCTSDILKTLRYLFSRQLDFFSLMYMESRSNININQLFLWLQEKSLFSMGALLFNPSPGVKFRAVDLVRNLLISAFIDLPPDELELIYRQHWIEPLELHFRSPSAFDAFLTAYIAHRAESLTEPLTGFFETVLLPQIKASGLPFEPASCQGILIYSRFHAIWKLESALHAPGSDLALFMLKDLAAFRQASAS